MAEERSAHDSEFDVVAQWTASELAGRDHASVLAGASRGSGSPSALAWLGESLRFGPGARLLDVGAGLGGPAAWAAARYGIQPIGVEPMVGAAEGAERLFAHPTLVGRGDALPFADATFDAAWTLGVLDTLDDPVPTLAEVRRCLVPDGRFGVLAYVADEPIDPVDLPEGNRFVSTAELAAQLMLARFAVVDHVSSGSLPDAPLDWTLRQERLDEVIASEHHDDPRWHEARANESAFSALLEDRRVTLILINAICV